MFKKLGLVSALSLLAAQAQAAVPPAIITALSDAGADAAVVGAAVTVVIVGIFAIKLVRRAL